MAWKILHSRCSDTIAQKIPSNVRISSHQIIEQIYTQSSQHDTNAFLTEESATFDQASFQNGHS